MRVIQEGEIKTIGRTEKIKVDVRIIATTNKLLQKEISTRGFREDLFYRLNVVPIYAPPLCERPEDIPVLWEHFMYQMSVELGKSVTPTKNAAFSLLMKYQWPGNVRELENFVQRLLLTHNGSIGLDVIHESLFTHPGSSKAARADDVFFQDAESVFHYATWNRISVSNISSLSGRTQGPTLKLRKNSGSLLPIITGCAKSWDSSRKVHTFSHCWESFHHSSRIRILLNVVSCRY